MNIATPSLLILLGILPGIIFLNTFFSGKFSRKFKKITVINELAGYLLLSIPFVFLTIYFFPESVDIIKEEIVCYIFNGNLSSLNHGAITHDFSRWTSQFWKKYLLLIFIAWVTGSASRKAVWSLRLDLKCALFKMNSQWYYELHGRKQELKRWFTLTNVDILTFLPKGDTVLYRGIISDFDITENGENLKFIIITDAKRGKGRGKEFDWIDIPGNRFIVAGSNIHSINITYIPVDVEMKFFEKIRLAFISYFFEQN